MMCEVIKALMANNTEEETWSWIARDIILDTWTALLIVCIIFFILLYSISCYYIHAIILSVLLHLYQGLLNRAL